MTRRLFITLALSMLVFLMGYFLFFQKKDWQEQETPPPPYYSAIEKFSKGDTSKGLEILNTLRKRYRSPLWEKRWHFLSGYWHFQLEQANPALEHFLKSYTEEDHLHSLSLYYGALSAMKAKKSKMAVAQCRALLEKNRSHPFAVECIYLLADALMENRDFQGARAVLFQYKDQLKKDSSSAFLFKLASVDLKAGKKEKALKRFKEIYCLYPLSPESLQLETEIGFREESRSGWNMSDITLLLQRGDILESHRKFREALRLYQSLQIFFPEYAPQAELMLRLGRSYYELREIPKALDHLNQVQGNEKLLNEAKFFLAKISLYRGRIRAFKRNMEALVSLKKEAYVKAKASLALAEYYDTRGKWSRSLPYYKKFVNLDPSGEKVRRALWRMALIHFLNRDFRTSLSILGKILNEENTPYRTPATFWAARCEERLKNKEKALELYDTLIKTSPFEYYGMKAEERLLKLSPHRQRVHLISPKSAHDSPMIPKAIEHDFAASGELVLLGLNELALQLLDFTCLKKSQRRIDPFLKASEIALELDEPEQAEAFVKKGLAHVPTPLTEIPPSFLKLIYPKKETLNICQTAERFSLDCLLVHAIILQESAFNASAVSRSGAIGLMQIMPDTGKDIAKRMKKREHYDAKLFDSQYNLLLGCSHFSRIMNQFNGSMEFSLSAYNAGEANTKKWRRRFVGHDAEEFVDNIPYFETRNYIKKIKGHYKIYSELYGS